MYLLVPAHPGCPGLSWESRKMVVCVCVCVCCNVLVLEDRGHIRESIHILVSIDRVKQKCLQFMTKWVSTAAVSALSVACSMLTVQQQSKLCCRSIDSFSGISATQCTTSNPIILHYIEAAVYCVKVHLNSSDEDRRSKRRPHMKVMTKDLRTDHLPCRQTAVLHDTNSPSDWSIKTFLTCSRHSPINQLCSGQWQKNKSSPQILLCKYTTTTSI